MKYGVFREVGIDSEFYLTYLSGHCITDVNTDSFQRGPLITEPACYHGPELDGESHYYCPDTSVEPSTENLDQCLGRDEVFAQLQDLVAELGYENMNTNLTYSTALTDPFGANPETGEAVEAEPEDSCQLQFGEEVCDDYQSESQQ